MAESTPQKVCASSIQGACVDSILIDYYLTPRDAVFQHTSSHNNFILNEPYKVVAELRNINENTLKYHYSLCTKRIYMNKVSIVSTIIHREDTINENPSISFNIYFHFHFYYITQREYINNPQLKFCIIFLSEISSFATKQFVRCFI